MDFVVASDYFTNAITLWRMYLSISSVMSNSLQPHGLHHARPPCPHQLPEYTQTHVHWFGDAIQPSHPLSSPSPPALNLSQPSGSFQMSQLFASGGQSIRVLASTSVLPMNTQDSSHLLFIIWPLFWLWFLPGKISLPTILLLSAITSYISRFVLYFRKSFHIL